MKEDEQSKETLVAELHELRTRISKLEVQNSETEKALVDSKEIYRSITNDVLDSSRVGIIILDASFRIVWVNQSLARYFGLRIVELIGKFENQLIEEKLKHIFEHPDAYATKILATYTDNTYIEQLECHILENEERKERWLELWSRPIRSGLYKGGRIEHYTDITSRKQAELFLRVAKEYSEKIINSSIDIIISVDMNRKVIEFNKAAQEAFGYAKDEILGKHVDILYANPKEGLLVYEKTLANGNYVKEISNRKKNGEIFKVDLSASVIYDKNNKASGLMGISRNCADISRVENEIFKAEKLESIGRLAGGIAHDFNNLLTSVIGNITLVETYLASNDLQAANSALEMAKKVSQNARVVTQKLLTFAKGGTPIREAVATSKFIRETISSALNPSKIKEVLVISDDLWTLKIDKEQVQQVMQNLITNANEAIPDDGTITITAKNVFITEEQGLPLTNGNYVQIEVHDTGVGILVDHTQRIFDPFFTTKRKRSGLGLATAYSIIRQHDGFIKVDSNIGAGTAFKIYLPTCGEPIVKQTQEKEKYFQSQSKGKVLVLDDEQCITAVAGKMLTRIGYTVETATTGEQAVELFQKAKEKGEPFDVAILDLAVGSGIGGKEVMQLLREIDATIKAIVSSGYFDDPIMANYQDYGFNGIVKKPYTFAALSGAVDRLLEDKS